MGQIGWFVEGVATYVSGQVDEARLARAHEAITNGKAPERLSDAWSGPYRYAVAGTLVEYIDETYGRSALKQLMRLSTQEEILGLLGVSEEGLIASWKSSIIKDD